MKRVYFIKPVGMQGPVKIGTSIRPAGRCSSLAAWSPFPLEVVAEIEGDELLEARFHRMFVASHERLEWFTWTPELQAVIDAIAAGSFNLCALPEYAGRLATLQANGGALTELDEAYAAALREHYSKEHRHRWDFRGRVVAMHQFRGLKDESIKRKLLADLTAYDLAPAQADAA